MLRWIHQVAQAHGALGIEARASRRDSRRERASSHLWHRVDGVENELLEVRGCQDVVALDLGVPTWSADRHCGVPARVSPCLAAARGHHVALGWIRCV